MGLKEKRKIKGLNQTELATAIGLKQSVVSAWEVGVQELPVRNAKRIAEVLGCDWKDLYD
ncbi:MAG: helix-turn-helix transcriptional regulator [Clostridiales bacterium]|nr:helix-turn-helix transcriptional regulator [Clostridiales bacterium]MDU1041565.1 helix-turn-helix transcriptional regulator [Clostridiales bacterium]